MLTEAIFMGVFSTLLADLWHAFLKNVAGLPVANWAMVGRWVAGFFHGVFIHQDIKDTASIQGECVIGWIFHYLIGIVYAGIYLLIVYACLGSFPTLYSALVFGMVTLVAPWFIMQPALGMGIMAKASPYARVIRMVSISTHALFGVGLYLAYRALHLG